MYQALNDRKGYAQYEYIGPELKIASIIALIVGIVFLGAGIYQDIKEKKK